MTDKIDTSPEAVERLATRLHDEDMHEEAQRHTADTLRALSARVAELEAKNRALTLEVISANGQAIDAYDAQKTAEARFIEQRDSLVSATKKLVKTEAKLAKVINEACELQATKGDTSD